MASHKFIISILLSLLVLSTNSENTPVETDDVEQPIPEVPVSDTDELSPPIIVVDEHHKTEKEPDISPSVKDDQVEDGGTEEIVVDEHHKVEEEPDISPSVKGDDVHDDSNDNTASNEKKTTEEKSSDYRTNSVCSNCKFCKVYT